MEKVSGVVHRITYQNQQNGYCVLKMKSLEENRRKVSGVGSGSRENLITITGSLLMLAKGDQVDFLGEWKNHSKYGTYLEVEKFHVHSPTTESGLKKFLATRHFKGIGPKLAEKLIERFGQNLPEIIENYPDKLSKIKGITKQKAQEIHRAWNETKIRREEQIYLQGLGLSPNLSQKVIEQYQGAAVQKVRENPYQLAQDIWGVGFTRADEIGQQIGFEIDHPFRMQSGISHALIQALEQGHLYLPKNELVSRAQKLLVVKQEQLVEQINKMLQDQRLIIDQLVGNEAVYLNTYHQLESELAQRLKNLSGIKPDESGLNNLRKINLVDELEDLGKEENFSLGIEQKKAIKMALIQPVSILTGGPGTGKSTTIKTLAKILDNSNKKFALAAPTGRAAKRITELTGFPAYTLHRLLKLQPGEIAYYNENNPLDYDVVVVDECSMLDVILAHHLVSALSPGTHLLLVGDADQLPSVQAGNVLADLISSGSFPMIELKTIFRQAQESAIILNAHRIKKGFFPKFLSHPTDFYLFPEDDLEQAGQLIVDLVAERIPRQFGFNSKNDIQVLAPLYKTKAGVSELNKNLQEMLNPPMSSKNELKFGFQTFREGDRVMQLSNNYEKEVFNGEVGKIVEIKKTQKGYEVLVRFNNSTSLSGCIVSYQTDDLKELTLAYAVSVHKSQGSEYPVVVMPILTSHYIMLQRNLLYTAVTRAKELVVLVGSKKALYIALKNDQPQLRYSGLKQRLKNQ